MKQPNGLISTLLDKNADFGDRSDAAMDLELFSGPEVEDALLKTVNDQDVDADLATDCCESLVAIWVRENRKPKETALLALSNEALYMILSFLDASKPEWSKGIRVLLK